MAARFCTIHGRPCTRGGGGVCLTCMRDAHKAVEYALRKGVLVRPEACEKCGERRAPLADGRAGIEFHHTEGYDPEKRFVGKWWCRECHKKEDAVVSDQRT